jgi:hypothetical protein
MSVELLDADWLQMTKAISALERDMADLAIIFNRYITKDHWHVLCFRKDEERFA